MNKKSAWFIWLVVSLFYSYQYVLRVIPNVMMDEIIDQFQINSVQFGQFSGVYYLGYALIHIPLGILFDRYGPKRILPICMLLTSLGLAPMLFAENWIYPVIGRILIGIGSSGAILGAFKIIRMGFREEEFTRMLSIAVTIGLMGAIYGGGPVRYLSETLGYQSVIMLFFICGIVFASISYLTIPKIAPIQGESVLQDIFKVLANFKVMLLCICAGLMVGPLEGFADVWGAKFLNIIYDFTPKKSSYLSSLIFLGMCFGAPVLSLIAERTGKYLETIIGSGILMLTIFTMLIFESLSINSMIIGFIIVGICCAYQIIAIYKASTYVPESLTSLTTAVANMVIMLFGYGFHSTIGYVAEIYKADKNTSIKMGVGVVPSGILLGLFGLAILLLIERALRRKDRLSNLV